MLGLLLTGRQIVDSTELKENEKSTKHCFAIILFRTHQLCFFFQLTAYMVEFLKAFTFQAFSSFTTIWSRISSEKTFS